MDAHNLAWKLGLLVKGIAKPNLLNTYEVERRENAFAGAAVTKVKLSRAPSSSCTLGLLPPICL